MDNYTINFESEENVKLQLNYMIKKFRYLFQLIVMDDDDEKYIPKFDFDYSICDCSKENLYDKNTWDEFINSKTPIIFINTSNLFKQFENHAFLGENFISGISAFSNMFYFWYRDVLWSKSNAKLIFLLSEENAFAMYDSVNNGFSIELGPIYMRKDVNKEYDENQYSKTFKKIK